MSRVAVYRYGSYFNFVGYIGFYWPSAPYGSDRAYILGFDSSDVKPADNDYRYCGDSVRLVTE